MDLHHATEGATAEERAAVDAVLGQPETGWVGGIRSAADSHVARGGHAARARRDLLLPVLHSVQSHVGWISHAALDYVGTRLTIPPAEAYGVASFYALLSTTPQPRTVVHVCDDIACQTAGAEDLCALLEAEFGPPGTATDHDTTWHRSPCLGQCDKAPAALVQHANDESGAYQTLVSLTDEPLIAAMHAGPGPMFGPGAVATERSEGAVAGGWGRQGRSVGPGPQGAALAAAIARGPSGVIEELKTAKLLGRGGAAFPTGVKWEAVANQAARPHYVVCNADESEPGTFKDRVLIESDPMALLEAMAIAGFATGSEQGYLYIRGEYPDATRALHTAIEQARADGLLGPDVLGHGFAFDVELRQGAGAYICGEETALFNSIEGYRGEPRNKPPFPVERGLFGRPTVVNNVETLVNVLRIVTDGGAAFAATGTTDSTGTRFFCVSGSIEGPGVYEVEMGATLGDVLELAGGVRGGRPLQAILLGGAAGTFVGPGELDLPLSFEATRAAGTTLGSGVVMAFDDTVDLEAILVRIARFFRDESCGQCVPCRVGTMRQEEMLLKKDVSLLDDLAQAMRDASICGLGQTAANAIQSALTKFGVLRGARG